ncbi:MAG: glycosyltransferase family 4 protein [Chloroflexi bacterium]|nr:glycosyltransferase family 4 protein [Chloroflexota bacterium]
MRVLYISKALVVGTYQRKMEEIAKFPDVELRAIVPPYWREGEHRQVLERRYTSGYELVAEHMRFNGHYHAHYYPNLRRHLLEWRPDVVHVDEEPCNFATAHAIWHARRVGAKAIFFAWQNIYRVYPPPFYFFELFSLLKSHAAQAGTRQAQEVLRRKRFSYPSAVFPQFGVDAELFTPAPQPANRDEVFRIGFVGRLVPEKGIHVLLNAASRLSFPYRVQLIGTGSAERALRAQAESLGIQDHVEFLGPVSNSAMPVHYRALHVCVLPSLTMPNWKEQFGRVLIEAMSCGVPVVGSESGEIPEIIGDDAGERSGVTFPEGDVDALTTSLTALYQEPALRHEFGVQGRKRVLREFTQERIAAKTVLMYRQLTHGLMYSAQRQASQS